MRPGVVALGAVLIALAGCGDDQTDDRVEAAKDGEVGTSSTPAWPPA